MASPDDDSETWVEVEAIVATTHRVEKYGGVQLAASDLQEIAEALNAGTVPMIGQHDWARPVRARELEASIVSLPDGENAVRLVGLVHQDDWDAAGEIGGMSFTLCDFFGIAVGPHTPGTEAIKIAADGEWFTIEDIGQACSITSQLAPTEGARLLQFSAFELARISLELGLAYVSAWGPGIAQNAIWDGLKYLMLHRLKRTEDGATASRTRIELVTPLPLGAVTAVIDTNEPEVAQRALTIYSEAVARAAETTADAHQVIVWRSHGDGGSWEDLGPQG